MLLELHLLFKAIHGSKKSRGVFNHKRFILALKATNALFDNDEHHDSHEFANWLLDTVHENYLKNEAKKATQTGRQITNNTWSFISELFQGKLQNTVTCVTCEKQTDREENFFNLSIDIERNTSLIYCIKRFSVKELLNRDNKLYCERCLSKQVAIKEIQVSRFPKLLLVHLKRFKIDPNTYQQSKLSYRIPYADELRLEAKGKAYVYKLKGVVVHQG